MTAGNGDNATAPVQAGQRREPNDLLRQARLRTPSPSEPGRSMSQRELAEAVTAHIYRTTNRMVALDRHDISRWEHGKRRTPIADYRAALRAVLGVATDAELGFYVKRRAPRPNPDARPAPRLPVAVVTASGVTAHSARDDAKAAQLAVNPGPAVILASATPELLTAVIPLLAALNSYHAGDESSLTTEGPV